MPYTCACALLRAASESRKVQSSFVQTLLNAAGKKASTTGRPFCSLSVTGWRSWFVSVKSGAFDPTSTDIEPPCCFNTGGSVSILSWALRLGRTPRLQREQKQEVPVIEVQHLTKRYGRVTAVEDVSFRVERGEILGFLGPNGAG